MKNLTVRLSDLDHKRLSERAAKRGGTVSDALREVVDSFFKQANKDADEKAEHEKTRATVRDLDNALSSQSQDLETLKAGLLQLGRVFSQYVSAQHAQTGASK